MHVLLDITLIAMDLHDTKKQKSVTVLSSCHRAAIDKIRVLFQSRTLQKDKKLFEWWTRM
eukprot:766203-Hanusia_phi.AAC.1